MALLLSKQLTHRNCGSNKTKGQGYLCYEHKCRISPQEANIRLCDRCSSAHPQRSTGRQWQVGVGWNLNNTLLLLLSGPLQEPSAYKRPMDTSPEEHRGTKAGGNPNCRFRGKNWHLVQSLPGLSQETVIPRYDTHHNERCWSISWAEGVTAQRCGPHYGMQGKNILGLQRTCYGIFRGRPKSEENEGSSW